MRNVTDDEDCGVYCIMNLENGKKYIGSSKGIRKRWIQHISALRCGSCSSPLLRRAWEKYGEECFLFYVVEICSEDERLSLESSYIRLLNTTDRSHGYNIIDDAGAGLLAITQESRDRGGMKRRGQPMHPNAAAALKNAWSDPEKRIKRLEKWRAAMKKHDRAHVTDAYRRKLSDQRRGRRLTEEWKTNIHLSQRILSDDDIVMVARLKVNGMPTAAIAELANCSSDVVQRVVGGKRKHYMHVQQLIRDECDYKLEMALKRARDEYPHTTQAAA